MSILLIALATAATIFLIQGFLAKRKQNELKAQGIVKDLYDKYKPLVFPFASFVLITFFGFQQGHVSDLEGGLGSLVVAIDASVAAIIVLIDVIGRVRNPEV